MTKQFIAVINGPAGVGKTTISRMIAEKFDNSVHIEGDRLKKFIINKNIKDVKGQMGYKNGGLLAGSFIQAGFQAVIFDYIFNSKQAYSLFCKNIKSNVPIFFFTLWADYDVVKDRELKRVNRKKLGEKVQHFYDVIKPKLHELGTIVEAGNKTKEQITENIMKYFKIKT